MDNSKELDQIVRELTDASEARRKELGETLQVDRLADEASRRWWGDLLLVPGAPASMLIEGSNEHCSSSASTRSRIRRTASKGSGDSEPIYVASADKPLRRFARYRRRCRICRSCICRPRSRLASGNYDFEEKRGSYSMDDTLVKLVSQGIIDQEDAAARAMQPDDLEIMLKQEGRASQRGLSNSAS